jgi:uncharacterized membrane protein
MSFVDITYLIQQYWVFVLLALIIGILTGWFSTTRPAS